MKIDTACAGTRQTRAGCLRAQPANGMPGPAHANLPRMDRGDTNVVCALRALPGRTPSFCARRSTRQRFAATNGCTNNDHNLAVLERATVRLPICRKPPTPGVMLDRRPRPHKPWQPVTPLQLRSGLRRKPVEQPLAPRPLAPLRQGHLT